MNIIVNNYNNIRITGYNPNVNFEDIKFLVSKEINIDTLIKCKVDGSLFDLILTTETKENYHCYKPLKLQTIFLESPKKLSMIIDNKETDEIEINIPNIDWNISFTTV